MLNMLNVAQTGLSTSQIQVENVMNNLANENTEGYTKRVVNVSELEQSDARLTGRGVSVDNVTRINDDYMYNNLITEEAKLNDVTTLNTMLNTIESIFYETDDTGLSADLNRYFESIENLKTSPDNVIYKSDLTSNGNILVTSLQELYQDIEDYEETTKDEVSVVVNEINSILSSIGEVSQNILESTGSTNDLLDKRDSLEKELAKYIDVEISRDEQYKLTIGGMTAINIDTNVRQITLIENYTPQSDSYVEIDTDGGLIYPIESNLINTTTWGSDIDLTTPQTAEVQHIPISGTSTGQITFLGHEVASTSGGGESTSDIITKIMADGASGQNVIDTWNAKSENSNKQISTLAAIDLDGDGVNDGIKITYDNTNATTGDVATIESIPSEDNNGIALATSIEFERGGDTSSKSEVQTMQLTGATTGQAYFLGTAINGSLSGDTAATTAANIANSVTNPDIITNWNNDPDNKDNQIKSIADLGNGKLEITYKEHMGDVSIMEETSSRGITYHVSEETTKGAPEDSITYTLNNQYSVTVTNGESIYEFEETTLADINGDGELDQNDIVDQNNAIQALVYKINQNADMNSLVEAYNGPYELAEDGTKILTNNPLHSDYDENDPNKDRYLVIESKVDGESGSFTGEIVVNDNNNIDSNTGFYVGVNVSKENELSQEAIDDIHIEMYEQEMNISGGMLSPMLDNIKTDSGNNIFAQYKEMLDNFAQKLSDYSSDFIETSDGNYVYGTDAAQIDASGVNSTNIGLFIGSDVKSLEFQDNSVNNLSQDKIDYLASIQWKDDIDFNKDGQSQVSFSEYYQSLRFEIANTREDVIFNQESQEAINESIQNTYDLLTKVDSDEEMIALIKFQSAYEANAKMITIVDEMLQTLLNMKN